MYKRPIDRLKQFLFCGRKQFFHAVRALEGVSLEIKRGEAVGIIGVNGSGKSTLLQLICGTLAATSGEVEVKGRISALLELGSGFNPQFTGRENVFLNGAILGLSKAQVVEKFTAIAEFADIGEFMEHPVSTYSSGMVVRLAFAVAVVTEPNILVVDEALAVGDEAFQRKCFAHIAALKERGCTLLFVSHSARTIIDLCDRALLMDAGELILDASPKMAMALYQKLLYSPPPQRSDIRARIKTLLPDASAEQAENILGNEAASALHDPAFTPQSTVYFAPHGAVIQRPRVTTLDGQPANQLARRQKYRVTYDVEFSQAAREVRFGMMIKTPTGVALAGGNSINAAGALAQVKEGERMRVAFDFTCLLMPGTYFINCGCSGTPEAGAQDIFLHRILDACSFRVLAEPGFFTGGVADLMVETKVEALGKDTKLQSNA